MLLNLELQILKRFSFSSKKLARYEKREFRVDVVSSGGLQLKNINVFLNVEHSNFM